MGNMADWESIQEMIEAESVTDVTGVVLASTPKAILLNLGDRHEWFPKKCCYHRRNVVIGKNLTLEVPDWLMAKKGLL